MHMLLLDDITHYSDNLPVLEQLLRTLGHRTSIKPDDITPQPEQVRADDELLARIRAGQFYKASDSAKEIARTAQPDEIELVVIGNNMGEGLALAELLDPGLHPKTIIVSFDPIPDSDRGSYQALGITRFVLREDLHQELALLEVP